MTANIEDMDAAWRLAWAKSDKGGAKLSAEKTFRKLRKHESCHGKLDALLGQFAPDSSRAGVVFFAFGEANSSRGEMGYLKRFDVFEQSMMLDVPGKICENDVVHFLLVPVRPEETAAAEEAVVRSKKKKLFLEEETSLKTCKIETIRLLVMETPFFCPEVDRHVFGEAGLVNFKVFDNLAHSTATETVDEVQ